jgi:hypothetical protein
LQGFPVSRHSSTFSSRLLHQRSALLFTFHSGSVYRLLKLRLVGKVTNGDLPLSLLLLLLLRDTCSRNTRTTQAAAVTNFANSSRKNSQASTQVQAEDLSRT